MHSDTIADMLTRIRNGYLAKKASVAIPHSKVKEAIARTLVAEKFLEECEVVADKPQSNLIVKLRYTNQQPAITKLSRISKAGRRVYRKNQELPFVLSGYGTAIISTSQGVMPAKEARKRALGGEVICTVY